MGFLEIVLTVCALANPDMCEDQHIILDADMSLDRCVMQAQPAMAQWAVGHPEWTITRWHCDYSGRQKQRT